MSILTPVNKILVIEKDVAPPPKPDQFGFILPEKVVLSRHVTVQLKSASEGSAFDRYVGKTMVVVSSMIEEIEIKGNKHYILPENGVIAIVAESELF